MNLTKTKLYKVWSSKSLTIVFYAYILIAVIATIQGLTEGPKVFFAGGPQYIAYNNFRIFKFSFYHLVAGKDIYQWFLGDHWDLYKYSPAFALSFGLLAWMPDIIGLFLWNLINSLFLFWGVRLLPGITEEKKSWLLLFCLLEMLNSIQNTQSNGLMVGLIVLAFALAEKEKYFWSTLCVVFSFYIKIYGALAFVFYLFYPGKWKAMGWSIFWMVFFALIPLVVVDGHQLLFLYKSWLHLLSGDRAASMGLSIMGMLGSFGIVVSKNGLTIAGIILFLLPLIRVRQYGDLTFRLLYLANTLIWLVIFNHKAESPTFIIAMAGVGIWYFCQRPSTSNLVLLILSFFMISMSVSDLVPAVIRDGFVRPHGIKALMAIVVWCKIVYEQLTLTYRGPVTEARY